MASTNLESYYRTIQNASKGEDVRDAIIGASRISSKERTIASTLQGADPKTLALKSVFNKATSEIMEALADDTVEQFGDPSYASESKNVLTSGTLYSIINTYVRPSLAYLCKFENDPVLDKELFEAINYYISTLQKAKEAMAKSIKSKGENPDNVKEFRDFAELITKIGEHAPTISEHLDITDLSKTEYGGHTEAWKSVSVSIGENVCKATNNQTYTPDKGQVFTKIEVAVGGKGSGGSSGKPRSTGDSGVVVTDDGLLTDGYFTANTDTEPYKPEGGAYGWQAFTVEVQVPDIDENSTFTVTFFDDGTEIASVEVPAYGMATMENPPSTKTMGGQTWYFVGWEPLPIHVVADMSVRATWSPDPPGSGSEITDSWETICLSRGAKYQIHDYKTLTVDGKSFVMEKVANGMDTGSTSTWIAKNVEHIGDVGNWLSSAARTYLNGTFLQAIRGSQELMTLADAIVPVSKYTMQGLSTPSGGAAFVEVETQDRIWVPSARELFPDSSSNGPLNLDSFLEYYGNGKNPSTHQYESRTSSYNPNFIGYGIYMGFESKGAIYNEAYGGSTYEIVWTGTAGDTVPPPHNAVLIANPSSPQSLVKTTNNQYYNLRSCYLNGDGSPQPIIVNPDGTMLDPNNQHAFGDAGSPIGFCL